MNFSFNSLSCTSEAKALAAAIFISSTILVLLTIRAPLNKPGKTRTLLIWLGKSDLPVATILAPPSKASSGMISGIGLAKAKTIGSFFIVLIISVVTKLGPETPMKISAPTKASAKVPCCLFLFVILAIFWTTGLRSGLPS